MFSKHFKVISACFFLAYSSASASSIIVIQGDHSSFGRKYFSGFSSLVRESILAFQYTAETEKSLLKRINQARPDLILTIGEVPLEKFMDQFPSTPFIVGDYQSPQLLNKGNIVLMESNQPVAQALEQSLLLLGQKKRLGTVYDPKFSSHILEKLEKTAQAKGMKMVAGKVDKAEDVKSLIPAFAGKIDLFIYIRDTTTSQDIATQAVYNFCKNKNIPVISLDPSHTNLGALMTLSIDPTNLGEQAWNAAQIILTQRKLPQMSQDIFASELTLNLSLSKAFKQGLSDRNILEFVQERTKANYTVQISQ